MAVFVLVDIDPRQEISFSCKGGIDLELNGRDHRGKRKSIFALMMTNDTPEGRQQNRRVEIAKMANESSESGLRPAQDKKFITSPQFVMSVPEVPNIAWVVASVA